MVENFISYVMSFYGSNGLYSFNFKESEVIAATAMYKASLSSCDKEFVGDSIDRENVRDLVLSYREKILKTV